MALAPPLPRSRATPLRRRAPVAAVFCATGVAHFLSPDPFVAIVPDWLPAPLLLTHLSGAAEIAGGVGMLAGRRAPWAGAWLVATLLAVFPANVDMALRAQEFPQFPDAALWLRLPLQGVLIGWVAWASGLVGRR